MSDSIYQVNRWKTVLDAPRLLFAPDKLITKRLSDGNGLFQTYVGSDPVIFTDRLDLFESILGACSHSFRKSSLSQTVIRQYVGDGLVSLEGEEWQRHRVAMNRGFDRRHVETMADKVGNEVRGFLSALRDSECLDWCTTARELALRSIAKLLFSAEFEPGEFKELESLVRKSLLVGTLEARFETAAFILLRSGIKPRLMKKLNGLKRSWLNRVNARKHSDKEEDDLLQLLLDAETNGGKFSDQEIIAELVTFFFAGHDTTATTLAWLGFEVSQRSNLQEKIREEINKECGEGEISFSSLRNLSLLRSTVMEVLRLHPPAWVIDREADGDQKIGSIAIKDGTNIILCIHSMHRNEKYWSDPDTFREARFLDGKPGSAWMPFGAGARQCIGQYIAMMQIQITFAYLLRDYTIRKKSRHVPRKRHLLTMQMKSSLPIELARV